MNVGISVSRVGGNAQVPAMKKVAGGLRRTLPRSASSRPLPSWGPTSTPPPRGPWTAAIA